MSIAEIRKLPIREKFQILQALWEDMHEEVDRQDIPESHKKILDDCHARIERGEEKLIDWEIAKKMIGRK